MKYGDKLQEFVKDNEEFGKLLELNLLGTNINMIRDLVEEIGDVDLNNKFMELQELLMKKRDNILEKECVK